MIKPSLKSFKSKHTSDKIAKTIFMIVAILSASTIIVTVVFIFIQGVTPFIKKYNTSQGYYSADLGNFLIGTNWYSPPNKYGILFIIINTLLVVFGAILISAPISILTALFITKIAPKTVGKIFTYVVELLASIPSIIFGLFGLGFITKIVKFISSNIFGYQSAGGLSALSSVLVLSIMIIPTITLLSITAINAVNKTQEQASLALGATKTQTNFKIVLRCARSGIFAAIILAVGRAFGEATAVSMVAGNAGSGPTLNPFDLTRTLTTTMLFGIKETTGMDYDIRFSVGLVLILMILSTNVLLNYFKKRATKYDV